MKNIVVFMLALLLFTSCDDFFSTTLTVDPPAHEDQIVTSAFFTNADTNLQVLVNRSTAILENTNQNTSKLENTTVQLFSEEQLLTTIPTNTNFNQTDYNHIETGTDIVFEAGKSYTMKVNHPDYEEAVSTIVVPNEVVPFSMELEADAGVDEFGDRSDRVTVEFTDPEDEENFYEVALFSVVTYMEEQYYNEHYISSLDPNVQESLSYSVGIISDAAFNGQDYKLQLDFYGNSSSGEEEIKTFLIWRNVTKDYYQYATSIRQQINAEDFGPFAEPVTIKSNFENGLGLFSVNLETVYPL